MLTTKQELSAALASWIDPDEPAGLAARILARGILELTEQVGAKKAAALTVQLCQLGKAQPETDTNEQASLVLSLSPKEWRAWMALRSETRQLIVFFMACDELRIINKTSGAHEAWKKQ